MKYGVVTFPLMFGRRVLQEKVKRTHGKGDMNGRAVWLDLCPSVSERLWEDGEMELGASRSNPEGPSISPGRIYVSFCNGSLP